MSKHDEESGKKMLRAIARAAMSQLEKQKRAGKTERYDAGMIEDSLEQLMWELRIAHSDTVLRPGACHPELQDQEVGFLSKYGTYLLSTNCVENDGVTPAELNRAEKTLSLHLRSQYAAAIECLESLQPVLEVALRCADPDHCVVQSHRASDLLAFEDEGDDE